MAKDPAFLFYPGDWLGGTLSMTHLEKGCYMDLLMLQFNTDKFTIEQAKHILGNNFEKTWPVLEVKFLKKRGLYWNEKLAYEKARRVKYSESRSSNRKSKDDINLISKSYQKDMENENEINIIDKKEKKSKKEKQVFIPPSIEEVISYFISNGYTKELGYKVFHYYNDANWHDSKGSQVKNWKQKARGVWFKEENKIPTNNLFSHRRKIID